MNCTKRSVAVAVIGLGLAGVIGCSEDNTSNMPSKSGTADPKAPTASQYGQLQPKSTQGNPYGGSGGYPGANKAGGAGAGAGAPAKK